MMTENKDKRLVPKAQLVINYLRKNKHRFVPKAELLEEIYGAKEIPDRLARQMVYRANNRLKKKNRR